MFERGSLCCMGISIFMLGSMLMFVVGSMDVEDSDISSLANMSEAIAAEPSGWVWAKTVPSALTKAAWPAMPR